MTIVILILILIIIPYMVSAVNKSNIGLGKLKILMAKLSKKKLYIYI